MISKNVRAARNEAVRLGLKVFWPGVPCKHGHVGKWYVGRSGGLCSQCSISRAATPEGLLAQRYRTRGIADHDLPPPLVPGTCDICGNRRRLAWDHDHDLQKQGRPLAECHRGWLCISCNVLLGRYGDNAQGIELAMLAARTGRRCSTMSAVNSHGSERVNLNSCPGYFS